MTPLHSVGKDWAYEVHYFFFIPFTLVSAYASSCYIEKTDKP